MKLYFVTGLKLVGKGVREGIEDPTWMDISVNLLRMEVSMLSS